MRDARNELGFLGEHGKDWLQGEDATDWDHYLSTVGGLHLIAERSWFIRPDWPPRSTEEFYGK